MHPFLSFSWLNRASQENWGYTTWLVAPIYAFNGDAAIDPRKENEWKQGENYAVVCDRIIEIHSVLYDFLMIGLFCIVIVDFLLSLSKGNLKKKILFFIFFDRIVRNSIITQPFWTERPVKYQTFWQHKWSDPMTRIFHGTLFLFWGDAVCFNRSLESEK